jgi:hypothetical protein
MNGARMRRDVDTDLAAVSRVVGSSIRSAAMTAATVACSSKTGTMMEMTAGGTSRESVNPR